VSDLARERWLAERRELVTASDAAAILGFDPRRSSLSVYAEKIGVIESQDNDWMAFGRDVEGAIAKAYTRRTGRPALDLGAFDIRRHPDAPWLGATRDRETAGSDDHPAPADGPAPLECKAVAGMKASQWEEEPPVEYQIQVQIQAACTAAQWASLVALIGGLQVAWRDLLRNDRFLAVALPKLEEFHLRVQRREPPEEVDAKSATTAALKALYADEDGETLSLTDEAMQLADQWEAARVRSKEFEGQADELENKVRRLLGDASFAMLPDGSLLSLRVTNVKGYTRVVAPSSYRRLRRVRPRLRRRA
jgi:putative phage-type endonuclease